MTMPGQPRILEDASLTEVDLMAQPRAGSGRTLAFATPIYNSMKKNITCRKRPTCGQVQAR
jgi:superfamily II DNA/RNA helicase